MSFLSTLASVRLGTAPARAMARRGIRWLLMGLGFILIFLGAAAQLTPLPIHFPGLLVIVGGLVLVLRGSYAARRTFIRVQRRHPKVVFPLRRLLRREPEVMPVAWQSFLRAERGVYRILRLPRRWRMGVAARRRMVRRRR